MSGKAFVRWKAHSYVLRLTYWVLSLHVLRWGFLSQFVWTADMSRSKSWTVNSEVYHAHMHGSLCAWTDHWPTSNDHASQPALPCFVHSESRGRRSVPGPFAAIAGNHVNERLLRSLRTPPWPFSAKSKRLATDFFYPFRDPFDRPVLGGTLHQRRRCVILMSCDFKHSKSCAFLWKDEKSKGEEEEDRQTSKERG